MFQRCYYAQTAVRCDIVRYKCRTKNVRYSFSTRSDIHNNSSIEILAFEQLKEKFRQYGHLEAHLDPLQCPNSIKPINSLKSHHFYPLFTLSNPLSTNETGKQVYDKLRQIYCSKVGYEYQHLTSIEEKKWLANTIENDMWNKQVISVADRRNAAMEMLMGYAFENFMAKKFPTFKRYSVEGSDSMLPAVSVILRAAMANGNVDDVIIGMPHRGRLALLASILNYPARRIFSKVQGHSEINLDEYVDDVVPHISYSTSIHDPARNKTLGVSLLPNPSHLEIINAVTMGFVRAQQDKHSSKSMALLLHGDAAFAGQGCVPEALSLSQLPGYSVNGTIHVIVNNQIGFTTTKIDGRSTLYPSDIAKGLEIPVIHVNGESIDDVIQVCRLAVAYRDKFKKDIIIDLVTYRQNGHNEVDEPRFTQPQMYKMIDSLEPFPLRYAKGIETTKGRTFLLETALTKFSSHLENEFGCYESNDISTTNLVDVFCNNWRLMHASTSKEMHDNVTQPTGVDLETLVTVGKASVEIPASITIHERLQRTYVNTRQQALTSQQIPSSAIEVDWATAEVMAMGTLLQEGYSIRLAGQDSQRGTFSQRHAGVIDQVTERIYVPLNNLFPKEKRSEMGRLNLVNSNLCELAAMAFEYGYSWEDPKNLVIWEAQFGDFVNGAQIVVDQFLCCGESKWLRQSGLVLLLPHGYDGAGPDHSSGRLERFLQLVDSPHLTHNFAGPQYNRSTESHKGISSYHFNPNIVIVNASSPANYFHLLRRQMHRNFRKPLVVMAPKSMLRLKNSTSPLADMMPGTHFLPVLQDPMYINSSNVYKDNVKNLILCTGKVYYDLISERAKLKEHENHTEYAVESSVAIVRIEELSPFPFECLMNEILKFQNVERFLWVQEEPLNQGAWSYVAPHLKVLLNYMYASSTNQEVPLNAVHTSTDDRLVVIARPSMPSCGVGLSKRHSHQSDELFERVFSSVII